MLTRIFDGRRNVDHRRRPIFRRFFSLVVVEKWAAACLGLLDVLVQVFAFPEPHGGRVVRQLLLLPSRTDRHLADPGQVELQVADVAGQLLELVSDGLGWRWAAWKEPAELMLWSSINTEQELA